MLLLVVIHVRRIRNIHRVNLATICLWLRLQHLHCGIIHIHMTARRLLVTYVRHVRRSIHHLFHAPVGQNLHYIESVFILVRLRLLPRHL